MSRAFTKENDIEHAGIDIPERAVSPEINYVTPNGLQMLQKKSAQLEFDRAQLIGDDSPSSKQKIMRVEREIRYYFSRIDSAIVIYPNQQPFNTILFLPVEAFNTVDGPVGVSFSRDVHISSFTG